MIYCPLATETWQKNSLRGEAARKNAHYWCGTQNIIAKLAEKSEIRQKMPCLRPDLHVYVIFKSNVTFSTLSNWKFRYVTLHHQCNLVPVPVTEKCCNLVTFSYCNSVTPQPCSRYSDNQIWWQIACCGSFAIPTQRHFIRFSLCQNLCSTSEAYGVLH